MKKIILFVCVMVLTTQCLATESMSGIKEHANPIDKLSDALTKSLRADNKPSKDLIKKQADDIIMVYGGEDIKKEIEPSTYEAIG